MRIQVAKPLKSAGTGINSSSYTNIINNLAPNYLMQLLPPRVQQFSRYLLRNSEDFAVPVTRAANNYNSFLSTALNDWNVLSPDTRNAPTLNSFKHKLRNNQILVPKYFGTLHVSRIHNRIRLECCSLNSHLFKKNLIDNQLCSCGSTETTSHSHVLDTQHIGNNTY